MESKTIIYRDNKFLKSYEVIISQGEEESIINQNIRIFQYFNKIKIEKIKADNIFKITINIFGLELAIGVNP